MKTKRPNREFTYKAFREKYGELSFKERKLLIRRGTIAIFQSGFRGHSTRHPKKIRVLNFIKLKDCLRSLRPQIEEEPEILVDPPTFSLKTKSLPSSAEYPKGISRKEFKEISETLRGDYPTNI